jgi:hypothetical protein
MFFDHKPSHTAPTLREAVRAASSNFSEGGGEFQNVISFYLSIYLSVYLYPSLAHPSSSDTHVNYA